MARNPIVLLHGYSDSGKSFANWQAALTAGGFPATSINIASYVTLNNEITIDDLAEGLDRALQATGLSGQPFDAIVHSTGMLVMRAWLTASHASESRQKLLKHLVALAPATFGSPLAAQGRSLLGRIFKGNKTLGPDFLDSGDQVLFDLELASTYTWDLAHKDMIDRSIYGPDTDTPYVFIFDGTNDYGKLAEIFDHEDQAGSDGTVRWAGCALNTRKITMDLSRQGSDRFTWSAWSGLNIPLIPIPGVDHGQILTQPPDELTALVLKALAVASRAGFDAFHTVDVANSPLVQQGRAALVGQEWQQFVVRAVDGRDNPITDYSIELIAFGADGQPRPLKGFEEDVHVYKKDSSFGCFHVRLQDVQLKDGERLVVRIIGSTGSELVGYQGCGPGGALAPTPVDIDISDYDGRHDGKPSLFCPFTTTLVEIRLGRVPLAQQNGTYEIFQWIAPNA